MRTLEFKKDYEILNLNELASSIDERELTDKPLHGIQHYKLLEKIGEVIDKTNMKFNLDDIFVSKQGPSIAPGISKIPKYEEEYGKNSVRAYIFRRLITSYIIEYDNPEFNTKIAVAYHQHGVNVAFGANVKFCQNLSIFGYDYMYDIQKTQHNAVFDVINGWLHKYNENVLKFERIMNNLKQIPFNIEQSFKFIGRLTSMRVEKDSKILKNFINPRDYALNQGQISKFTENLLIEHQEKGELSAYDVYNVGTQLHKPEFTDVGRIIPQNTELGEMMLEILNEKI